MLRILLTGASGLLGQHVLQSLTNEGHQVVATYRNQLPKFFTSFREDLVQWVPCDICDITSLLPIMEHFDVVIHAAAMVSYDSRDEDALMLNNIEGTANVVNACLHAGISKLIFISSIASIGKAGSGHASDELTPYDEKEQSSNYGRSKFLAEMEVWRGQAEGLNVLILNPGIILGEGDEKRSSSNLFKIVAGGFPFYTQGSTAWVDVKDITRVIISFLNRAEGWNERYILISENRAFKDVFTQMATEMGVKPPHIFAGPWFTAIVWRLSYLKTLLFGGQATITKETAHSAQSNARFDNRKILRTLPGFEFNPISDTIRRVVQWRKQ